MSRGSFYILRLNLYYQVVNALSSLLPKHERVRQTLADAIASGQYEAGQRLPSESELVKTFGASRPTVNRALRELQLAGIIERRAGSGSYVRADTAARGYTFGLLIPELGRTEIFEPICRGMAEAQHNSLTSCCGEVRWGTRRTLSSRLRRPAGSLSPRKYPAYSLRPWN